MNVILSNFLFRRDEIPCPIILMYHAIAPARCKTSSPWAVAIDQFRTQLDILEKNDWKTILLKDIQQEPDAKGKKVVITFDDGYANNMEALYELKKRDMSATWFIVTHRIGNASNLNAKLWLNRSQILEIQDCGMEIGSHSRSHRRLTDRSIDELHAEITGSKQDLEFMLGCKIQSFAYPYGIYDHQIMHWVQKAGYRFACTTASGWSLKDCGLLNLRRITVFAHDSPESFIRKLAFADNEVNCGKVLSYYAKQLKSRFSK